MRHSQSRGSSCSDSRGSWWWAHCRASPADTASCSAPGRCFLPENPARNGCGRRSAFSADCVPPRHQISAQLQFARAVARRAERRLWTLNREDSVPEDILRFINRLSDLFFVMARMEMQRQGWDEERWQAFAYKRKRKQT